MQDFTTITPYNSDAEIIYSMVCAGIVNNITEVTDEMVQQVRAALNRPILPTQVPTGTYIITGAQKILYAYVKDGQKIPAVTVVITLNLEDGSKTDEILKTHRFHRRIATTTGDVTEFTPYLGGDMADILKKTFRGTPDEMVHKAKALNGIKCRIVWHEVKNDDYSGTDRWLEVNSQ